jgi:hypothetical protein
LWLAAVAAAPVSTETEEMWEHGNVMLGFDAEER